MSQSTLAKEHASGKAVGATPKSFRPDIQGLRALAVVAVILDHLFALPSGGFVGVDIFFVISGFLITGIMLKEHSKTGGISFLTFYRRRVRRIMPAAIVVLAVTVGASWFLLLGERYRSVLWDGLASAVFFSNWRFAATGTDYLQANGPVSPLQHFWSLSVEEQFYLAWPALLVFVLVILARRLAWTANRARTMLGFAMSGIAILSLGFALWETQAAPTVAYFSTFSRAWELGIGAMLALWVPWLARIPSSLRPVIQWLGLAGIVMSLFAIDSGTPFPAPGAVLPVVSAALVIGGGVGGQRLMSPLTNRVSRYVGDISYSLYLWHFPVIILVSAVMPLREPAEYVAILGATLLLSAATFHGIEDPIRRSAWMEPKPAGHMKPHRHVEISKRLKLSGVGVLALVTAVVCTVAVAQRAPTGVDSAFVTAPTVSKAASAAPAASPEAAMAAKIDVALGVTDWPELTPKLEELGSRGFQKEDSEGCAPATPRGKDCSVSDVDPAKLAVVVGDSTGVAWLPAIRAALEPRGWIVRSMTYVGCPFLEADTVAGVQSETESCPGHKELVSSIIKDAKPGLVIISNLYNLSLASGSNGEASIPAWDAAKTAAETEWLAGAKKVITLAPPPPGADPRTCVTKLSSPKECIVPVSATWSAYAEADEKATTRAGQPYVATRQWFCSEFSGCPLFVDGTIVRRDETHMTEEYAAKVAPLLASKLLPLLR